MRQPGTLRSVFVGSTSVDLRAYRAAVKAAIERMDQHPIVMENFGAQGDGDATSVSLENLAQATATTPGLTDKPWAYWVSPLPDYRKTLTIHTTCWRQAVAYAILGSVFKWHTHGCL